MHADVMMIHKHTRTAYVHLGFALTHTHSHTRTHTHSRTHIPGERAELQDQIDGIRTQQEALMAE